MIVFALFILASSIWSGCSISVSRIPAKGIDVARCLFIEPDWYYHYRPKGMMTSTDDVLTAYVATASKFSDCKAQTEFCSPRQVQRYVDLGCGIGSCLLLASYYLQPSIISVGIEVQAISASLAQQTVSSLPARDNTPHLHIENMDLRQLLPNADTTVSTALPGLVCKLVGKCDLVTANPPYCPPHSGTAALDPQRLNARFEMHGGIEEYCKVAHHLLDASNDESRFVFSFWSSQDDRVRLALQQANLRLKTVVKVTAGTVKRPRQYLNVYVAAPANAECMANDDARKKENVVDLDIIKTELPLQASTADSRGSAGCLSSTYVAIMNHLSMAKRPLRL